MTLIDKEIFMKIIKNVIIKFYKDNFEKKYKRKYTIEYYLELIFELINDINKWDAIKKLNIYKPLKKKDNKIPKYHWKSIQNIYYKWCKDNIFQIAFENYINNKTINLEEIDLYIDTSFINNKYGIEGIAMNTDNKKKKATKISILSDEDKFIYSIISVPISNNKKKYKKRRKKCKKRRKRKYIKKKKIKTKLKTTKGFIHDVNTIKCIAIKKYFNIFLWCYGHQKILMSILLIILIKNIIIKSL